MSSIQIEQKNHEMPPRDGFTITHFITVAEIDRSAGLYEKVFGGRILSRGDRRGASGHIQIANTWLIVNVGGGPTPDKPSVTEPIPKYGEIRCYIRDSRGLCRLMTGRQRQQQSCDFQNRIGMQSCIRLKFNLSHFCRPGTRRTLYAGDNCSSY